MFNLADRSTRTVVLGQGVTHLAFRPDSKQLAFTSFEQKELRIVELEHDEIVAVFQHPAELLSIGWSPNGRLLAAGCDDRLQDLRLGRGPHGANQCWKAIRSKPIHVSSFNPASEILTTSSSDGTTLWDAISGKRLVTGTGWCSGFSDDGTRLGFHDGTTLSVWKFVDGSECRRLHPGRVAATPPPGIPLRDQ